MLYEYDCRGLCSLFREATLTDEQRAEFYAPIPVMMHHFPHIFFMQQEMMRQQHMMQQQQPAASDKMQDIESLKKSGLLALLSSPDGREKMQELAQKVQTSKQRIEQEVDTFSIGILARMIDDLEFLFCS